MTTTAMTGLILAGGQARRMQTGLDATHHSPDRATAQGSQPPAASDRIAAVIDKGLLDLRGEPLVAHARRFLAPHVQAVLISANRNQRAYSAYGKVIADDAALGNSPGPLAGIERALATAQTPWLLVLPVDVVNLPPDLVPNLMGALNTSAASIAYARTAERVHPLCMVLHVSLADSLRGYLEAGDRKVQLWQNRHHAVPVLFEGDEIFFNVNTPEDLRYASQCWKS